jgi:hypothetical protein
MSRRTSRDLIEDYLRWLEPQLRDEHGNPSDTYWDLLNVMFGKEFKPVHPMDENRMGDGLDLRVEFAREQGIRTNALQNAGPCSFLEVLIGLSRRLAFFTGGEAAGWAWQLLGHLELQRMSDPLTRPKQRKTQEIMDAVINRDYAPDGMGSFFPLAWPEDDMTQIELWYQMSAYVGELHPEH